MNEKTVSVAKLVGLRLAGHIRAQREEIARLKAEIAVKEAPFSEPSVRAAQEDLLRWRKKATRAVRAGRTPNFPFDSSAIPSDLHEAISKRLATAGGEDQVKAAFSEETLRAVALARLEAAVGCELVARQR